MQQYVQYTQADSELCKDMWMKNEEKCKKWRMLASVNLCQFTLQFSN